MKKTTVHSSLLAFALLVPGAGAVSAQPNRPYDPPQYDRREERRFRERDLLALQDDLRLVDEALSTFPTRSQRYEEFQTRAEGIREEVTALANDNNRRALNRPGEGQVEIAALRLKIATLRDDIEDAQSRRRSRTGTFRIPAGTEIDVILNQDLSSRMSNPNDRVEASTITAVRLDGRTVIPAGALVTGTVREVRSRRRGQQDSWLRVDFDSLSPERGPTVPLRSHVVSISQSRDHDTVKSGGLGALLGGVIGGIIDGKKGALIGAVVGAGGGILASQDDDVDLPEGTLITLRLDGPMMVARR